MTDFKKLLQTMDSIQEGDARRAMLTEASPLDRAMKPIRDKEKMFPKKSLSREKGDNITPNKEDFLKQYERDLVKFVEEKVNQAYELGGQFKGAGTTSKMKELTQWVLSDPSIWKGVTSESKYDKMVNKLSEEFDKMDSDENL